MSNINVNDKDDSELLALALTGQQSAFEVLAMRYRSLIYQTVYMHLHDASESEDVCQEVLMKILLKGHLFEQRSSFKSWLYKLTCNASLNYLRKLKRQPSTNHEDMMLEKTSLESPDRILEKQDCQAQIQKCIDRLPVKQRETFVLKMYCDLKLDQIAETVGANISTVKTNISIATKKFFDCMENDNEHE